MFPTAIIRLLAAKYGLETALAKFESPQLAAQLKQINAELALYDEHIKILRSKDHGNTTTETKANS